MMSSGIRRDPIKGQGGAKIEKKRWGAAPALAATCEQLARQRYCRATETKEQYGIYSQEKWAFVLFLYRRARKATLSKHGNSS
jgi:hypothetical protein